MSDLKTICLDNECMGIKSESSTPWLVTKVDNTNGHYRRYSDGHFEMWGSVAISSGSYSTSSQGIFYRTLPKVNLPYRYIPTNADISIVVSVDNMYVTGTPGTLSERYDDGNMYFDYFTPAIHSLVNTTSGGRFRWQALGSF